MTVNAINITSGPYTGNGASDQYSYTFRVKDKTQLSVYETTDAGVKTLLTVDTDYTVAGVGDDAGGIITRIAGNLPTDYVWYIRSNYIETQLTAFASQGGFFPDVHEDQFDHITYLIQQILDYRTRSMRLDDSVDIDGTFTIDDDAATRASNFLGFDSNGDLVVVAGDIDAVNVSTYMATVNLAANAAAARLLLDAASLTVANVFTKTQYLKKGADIASANDMVLLADGNDNDVTGTVTVNGMTDGIQNEVRQFHADAAFILKHNTAASSGFSSLHIVQGAADITTTAGDEWKARYDGTVWRIYDYIRASAKSLKPAPFRGCKVWPSGTQSFNSGSLDRVLYDTEGYDTDSMHDNSTDTWKISLPSGTTKVRVTAQIGFNLNSGECSIHLMKNGGTLHNLYFNAATTGAYSQITSGVIEVIDTDYFEIRAQQNTGLAKSTFSARNNNFLAVEIIE